MDMGNDYSLPIKLRKGKKRSQPMDIDMHDDDLGVPPPIKSSK